MLDSTCAISRLVTDAKNKGYHSLAITDDGVMHGTIKFYEACQANNIKPIIGLKVNYRFNEINSSILLYAVNNVGYQNLMKISSKKKKKKGYVELEYLQKTSLGLIAVIPAKYNFIFNNFEKQTKWALDHYHLLKEIYHAVYMGVSIDSQYEQDKLAALCRFTKEYQIKMVALHEVACLSQDERLALDVLKTIKNPKYEKSQIDYSLHSNREMLDNFRGLDEAIQNTMEIANACNVSIKFGEYHMPSYSSDINSFDYLKALCFKGLQKRLNDKFINTNELIEKYQKRLNYEKQLKDHIAQPKEIERLQRMVDRFKGKPTKVSMARSKQKAIEHMEIIEAPDRYDNKTFHAHFQPLVETGNDVLFVSNLEIGYEQPLSTVNVDLKRGEKLGILGGNGLGKSTFLKTLVDKIPALSGEYKYGVNVQIVYFDQQMAMYQSNKTVLDDYWDEFPNLTETEVRNALGAFLFTGEDVFKNISMLSGGEKVRLALCKILKRRPNVLILDEPTNHMDIVGKETLETMLKDFKGTLIFVSHDRYFVKQIATQLLVFEDGTTNLYKFGYEEYQEKLLKDAENETGAYKPTMDLGGLISNKGASQSVSSATSSTTKKPNTNIGKERSKVEKKVKRAEEELGLKEEKLEELKAELLRPQFQSSYSKLTEIQAQIDAMEEEIMVAMEEWEELSTQLEELLAEENALK